MHVVECASWLLMLEDCCLLISSLICAILRNVKVFLCLQVGFECKVLDIILFRPVVIFRFNSLGAVSNIATRGMDTFESLIMFKSNANR